MSKDISVLPCKFPNFASTEYQLRLYYNNYDHYEILDDISRKLPPEFNLYESDGNTLYTTDPYGNEPRWVTVKEFLDTYVVEEPLNFFTRAAFAFLKELPPETMLIILYS